MSRRGRWLVAALLVATLGLVAIYSLRNLPAPPDAHPARPPVAAGDPPGASPRRLSMPCPAARCAASELGAAHEKPLDVAIREAAPLHGLEIQPPAGAAPVGADTAAAAVEVLRGPAVTLATVDCGRDAKRDLTLLRMDVVVGVVVGHDGLSDAWVDVTTRSGDLDAEAFAACLGDALWAQDWPTAEVEVEATHEGSWSVGG